VERLVGVMGMRRVDMSEIRISAGEFLAVKSSHMKDVRRGGSGACIDPLTVVGGTLEGQVDRLVIFGDG